MLKRLLAATSCLHLRHISEWDEIIQLGHYSITVRALNTATHPLHLYLLSASSSSTAVKRASALLTCHCHAFHVTSAAHRIAFGQLQAEVEEGIECVGLVPALVALHLAAQIPCQARDCR